MVDSNRSGTKAGGGLPALDNLGAGNGAQSWRLKTANSDIEGGYSWKFEDSGSNAPVAQDFTDTGTHKILIIHLQFEAPERIQCEPLADPGFAVWLSDSTTGDSTGSSQSANSTMDNYLECAIGGSDTFLGARQQGHMLVVIDPEVDAAGSSLRTTLSASAYDPSAATGYALYSKTDDYGLDTDATQWMYTANHFLLGTEVDDADTPIIFGSGCDVSDLSDICNPDDSANDDANLFCRELVPNVAYLMGCALVVGTGAHPTRTDATTFDDMGATFVWPADADSNDPRFHVTRKAFRQYCRLRSGDTARYRGTYSWGTGAGPEIDLESSNGTVTVEGSWTNCADFKINAQNVFAGSPSIEPDSGFKVISSGADFDTGGSKTITGDLDLVGLGNHADISDLTVTGTLDFDTAGTYNLNNCTIGTVTNSSGGSITINLNGGTITTNTGPNITIVNAVTVQANASTADGTAVQGARVYLEAGSGGPLAQGTVILNGLTNVSGIVEDTAFDFTSNQPVVGVIRKGTATPRYKTATLLGTITSAGLVVTGIMVSDES